MNDGVKRRTRKQRRQQKRVIQHGPAAKRSHKRKTGRTGSIFKKRLKTLKEDT